MANFLQKPLEYIYNSFKKDTAKMLIYTSVLGWALSSLAQIAAVVVNPKISKEQKGYMLPQEIMDAVTNVISFLFITQTTKKFVAKLASTGKIAPQKVRNFLNKHKDLYGNKVGKLDFDIDDVLKTSNDVCKEDVRKSYYAYKNFRTTVATVAAGAIASNVVTPIVRNNYATKVQKQYLANRPQNTSGDRMKI